MINYDDYESWENKIVLSPNATGKTQLAKKLYNISKEKGLNVQLFSASEIENLVNVSAEDIFVGSTSLLQKENKEIYDLFKGKNNGYYRWAKDIYNTIAADNLKTKSAYYKYAELGKLTDISSFERLKQVSLTEELFDLNDFNITILEQELSFELYMKIKKCENPKYLDTTDKKIIGEKEQKCLEFICEIIKYDDQVECPLCGTLFASHEELTKSINQKLSSYTSQEKENIIKIFKNIFDELVADIKTNNSLKKIFKIECCESLEGKIALMKKYSLVFEKVMELMDQFIIKSTCKQMNISQSELNINVNLYLKNQKEILLEKNSIENNPNFINMIISEFNNLVFLEPTLTLVATTKGFAVKCGRAAKKPNEILSESESKRLCLAVFKALILHNKTDYIR